VFDDTEVNGLVSEMEDLYTVSSQRAVTGTLSSHPDGRDVHIDSLSITFHGSELLVDTRLELNNGRRYGLIGLNGSGELDISVTRLKVCIALNETSPITELQGHPTQAKLYVNGDITKQLDDIQSKCFK